MVAKIPMGPPKHVLLFSSEICLQLECHIAVPQSSFAIAASYDSGSGISSPSDGCLPSEFLISQMRLYSITG